MADLLRTVKWHIDQHDQKVSLLSGMYKGNYHLFTYRVVGDIGSCD